MQAHGHIDGFQATAVMSCVISCKACMNIYVHTAVCMPLHCTVTCALFVTVRSVYSADWPLKSGFLDYYAIIIMTQYQNQLLIRLRFSGFFFNITFGCGPVGSQQCAQEFNSVSANSAYTSDLAYLLLLEVLVTWAWSCRHLCWYPLSCMKLASLHYVKIWRFQQ